MGQRAVNAALPYIALVCLLLGLFKCQETRIEDAQAERDEYKTKYEDHKRTVEDCERIAQETKETAEAEQAKVEASAERADKYNKKLEKELEKSSERYAELHSKIVGSCPAAADPAFIEFLCSGPAGCTSTEDS
jgi:uncharacterized protein YlxW (UPF0749 family)